MNKNSFNHDKFNTWENCRKKYYFKYLKELKWPDFSNDYKLGTSVHALINYYLKGHKIDHLLENAEDDIKQVWNVIKNHPILKNKVIATEWGFNTRVGSTNYWLNGRIDAILFDSETNKYIIADWKTGIVPKNFDKNFQHKLYLYSFFKGQKDLGLNIRQKDLIFQYVKISDRVDIFSIPYSQEKEKEYEEILAENISNMENCTDYFKTGSCPKECQYKYLCR